jgi:flagella basal body P-ring formation protein FlgA
MISLCALLACLSASALEALNSGRVGIGNALSERYPGAWIEIKNENELLSTLKNAKHAQYLNEDGAGRAYFQIDGKQVKVEFSAWIQAPIAVRRISPLEKLHAKDFGEQKMDLAKGDARPYRGLILSSLTNWSEYESKQTIPAGAFPTVQMVQRVPDVRRGDTVQVYLRSGSLQLTTGGIVQESALIGDKVRVLTRQGKREVVGILKNKDGIEVSL